MPQKSLFRALVCALALAALAGCGKAHVRNVESYLGPPLPAPQQVLVGYFAVTPDQVRLDQGAGARIQRNMSGQPLSALEMQAARETQGALARELVERLRRYGLPATLGDPGIAPGRDLLVEGQFVGIDEGNRTRRTLIGLGAGRSRVGADVQLYYRTDNAPAPRFLTAFSGEATSGRAPGAAETMGAGAVAGRLATSAALTGGTHAINESRGTSAGTDAGRLADELARQIAAFAQAQGWIPASAPR